MLEILKRIQTDVADIRVRVERLETDVSDIRGRVERLEAVGKKQLRDNAAIPVMMRATAGAFNERVSELEVDVQMLKDHGP